MGTFERFMSALNWLLVMLVCLGAIVWVGLAGELTAGAGVAMHPYKKEVIDFIGDPMGQITMVMVGLLVMLLNWVFVMKLVRKSRYQRSIRFQNPSGDVIVQLAAVEECLTRTARQTDDVHDEIKMFEAPEQANNKLYSVGTIEPEEEDEGTEEE